MALQIEGLTAPVATLLDKAKNVAAPALAVIKAQIFSRGAKPSGRQIAPDAQQQIDLQYKLLEVGIVPNSRQLASSMREGRRIPKNDLTPLVQLWNEDTEQFMPPAKIAAPAEGTAARILHDETLKAQKAFLDAGFFPRQNFPPTMEDRIANANAQAGNIVDELDFARMHDRYVDYRVEQERTMQTEDVKDMARAQKLRETRSELDHTLAVIEEQRKLIAATDEQKRSAEQASAAALAAAEAAEKSARDKQAAEDRIRAAEQGLTPAEFAERATTPSGKKSAPRTVQDVEDITNGKLDTIIEKWSGQVAPSTVVGLASKLLIDHVNGLESIAEGPLLRTAQGAKAAIPMGAMALCISLDYGFNAIGANALGAASSMGNLVAIPLSFIAGLGGWGMSQAKTTGQWLAVGVPLVALSGGVMLLGNSSNPQLIKAGESISSYFSSTVSDRDRAFANLQASEKSTQTWEDAIKDAGAKLAKDQETLATQNAALTSLRAAPVSSGAGAQGPDMRVGRLSGSDAVKLSRAQASTAASSVQLQREALKYRAEQIRDAALAIDKANKTISSDLVILNNLRDEKSAETAKFAKLEARFKDADGAAASTGNLTITGIFTAGVLFCSLLYGTAFKAYSRENEKNRADRQAQNELRGTIKSLRTPEGLYAHADSMVGTIWSRLSQKGGVTLPVLDDAEIPLMVQDVVNAVAGATAMKFKTPARPETQRVEPAPPALTA